MAEETTPDFGLTAEDYGRYRAGFPFELADLLAERGIELSGRRVLDLGTGTGSLARILARAGASVTGVDPAEPMLHKAEELDRVAGADITYLVATAEQTGLPDEHFDVVSAGQCWHWFDAKKAAAEARRVLRPGGAIIVAHFDWIPLPGNVVAATEALILKFNPVWQLGGGTGIYPRWLTDLALAGFRDVETFSFDLDVPYEPDAWVGRIRASAGVGASLPPEDLEEFTEALTQLLREEYPTEVLTVLHRTWAVTARKPEPQETT